MLLINKIEPGKVPALPPDDFGHGKARQQRRHEVGTQVKERIKFIAVTGGLQSGFKLLRLDTLDLNKCVKLACSLDVNFFALPINLDEFSLGEILLS